jgi:Zn-dependent protease
MTDAGYRLSASTQEPIMLFLFQMLIMNISLAVFNLLPFPPLDGSRVLDSILPASMRPVLDILEQYGFLILLMLMYFGLLDVIIDPVIEVVIALLRAGVR